VQMAAPGRSASRRITPPQALVESERRFVGRGSRLRRAGAPAADDRTPRVFDLGAREVWAEDTQPRLDHAPRAEDRGQLGRRIAGGRARQAEGRSEEGAEKPGRSSGLPGHLHFVDGPASSFPSSPPPGLAVAVGNGGKSIIRRPRKRHRRPPTFPGSGLRRRRVVLETADGGVTWISPRRNGDGRRLREKRRAPDGRKSRGKPRFSGQGRRTHSRRPRTRSVARCEGRLPT